MESAQEPPVQECSVGFLRQVTARSSPLQQSQRVVVVVVVQRRSVVLEEEARERLAVVVGALLRKVLGRTQREGEEEAHLLRLHRCRQPVHHLPAHFPSRSAHRYAEAAEKTAAVSLPSSP